MLDKIKSRFTYIFESFKADKILFIFKILTQILFFFICLTIILFSKIPNYNIIPKIISAIFIVIILLYSFFRGKIFLYKYILSLLFFLLYAALLTLLTTRDFVQIQSLFLIYLLFFATFQFIVNFNVGNTIKIMLFSIFVFALIYFSYYFKEIASFNFNRIGDIFGNVNDVSLYFSIGTIISVFYILTKRKSFIYLLPFIAFLLILSFTTGSKKGFFIPLISFVTGLFFLFKTKKQKTLLLSLIVILLIVFTISILSIPAFENLKIRIFSMFYVLIDKNKADGSSLERLNMFFDGISLWLKNLFFGYGQSGFYFNTYYFSYSHSNLIELLVNFGFIGFILFYFPFVGLFKKRSQENKFPLYMMFFLSIIIFGSFSLVFYNNKIILLLVALFLANDFLNNKDVYFYFAFSFDKKKPFISLSVQKSEQNPLSN